MDDEAAWVDRLLLVMRYLDPQTSLKGLLRATRLQERRPSVYDRFLDACIAYNVRLLR
jgi:sister-chromatid-cohesion protein PDS5